MSKIPFLRSIVSFSILAFTFLATPSAHAQGFIGDIKAGADATADRAGMGASETIPLQEMIGLMINSVLSLLGVILLGYLLYGGFIWMTAGDSKDKPETAKKIIKNAVIGLVLTILSFAIADFVLKQLISVTSGSVTTS